MMRRGDIVKVRFSPTAQSETGSRGKCISRGVLVRKSQQADEWVVARICSKHFPLFESVCIVPSDDIVTDPDDKQCVPIKALKLSARAGNKAHRKWLADLAHAIQEIDTEGPPLLPEGKAARAKYIDPDRKGCPLIYCGCVLEVGDTVVTTPIDPRLLLQGEGQNYSHVQNKMVNRLGYLSSPVVDASDGSWHVVLMELIVTDQRAVPVVFDSSRIILRRPFQCLTSMARVGSTQHQKWLAEVFLSLHLSDPQQQLSMPTRTVMQYLLKSATTGDKEAMYMLGVAGLRVDVCKEYLSEEQACMWSERAFKKGCSAAACTIDPSILFWNVHFVLDSLVSGKRSAWQVISIMLVNIQMVLEFKANISHAKYTGYLEALCLTSLDETLGEVLYSHLYRGYLETARLTPLHGPYNEFSRHWRAFRSLTCAAQVLLDMVTLERARESTQDWKSRIVHLDDMDDMEGGSVFIVMKIPQHVERDMCQKLGQCLIDMRRSLPVPLKSTSMHREVSGFNDGLRACLAKSFGSWTMSPSFTFIWRSQPALMLTVWQELFQCVIDRVDRNIEQEAAAVKEMDKQRSFMALDRKKEREGRVIARMQKAALYDDATELQFSIDGVLDLGLLPDECPELAHAQNRLAMLQGQEGRKSQSAKSKQASSSREVSSGYNVADVQLTTASVHEKDKHPEEASNVEREVSKREKQQRRRAAQRAARAAKALEKAKLADSMQRKKLIRAHPRIASAADAAATFDSSPVHDNILLATIEGDLVHAEVVDPKSSSIDERTSSKHQRRAVNKRQQQLTLRLADFHQIMGEDTHLPQESGPRASGNSQWRTLDDQSRVNLVSDSLDTKQSICSLSSYANGSHQYTSCSYSTALSWASAPARLLMPHCFLPDAIFKQADSGKIIRAAELRGSGGDLLIGPRESQVLTKKASKILNMEHDLVRIKLEGCSVNLRISADHRLLAEGPEGQPVPCSAGQCVQVVQSKLPCSLYNGTGYHLVTEAELFKEVTDLVEVTFEGDEAALAWLLPRRRRSSSVGANQGVPVAVLGKELGIDLHEVGFVPSRTFLDHPSTISNMLPGGITKYRSRSVGSPPDPRSSWSKGTLMHDSGKCNVCIFHQNFMNGLHAKPCLKGAGCLYCHASH